MRYSFFSHKVYFFRNYIEYFKGISFLRVEVYLTFVVGIERDNRFAYIAYTPCCRKQINFK